MKKIINGHLINRKASVLMKIILAFVLYINTTDTIFAQTELEPWGNIRGIRIDGQLMEFESKLNVVQKDWTGINATGKEKQRPKYTRNGNQQTVTTNIDSLYFTETVTDIGKDGANINVQLTAKGNESADGVFFSISLPATFYANATVQLDKQNAISVAQPATTLNKYTELPTTLVQFVAKDRQLKLTFSQPETVVIKNIEDKGVKQITLYIPIQAGDVQEGQTVSKAFVINTSGPVDKKPVHLVLNTEKTGRVFDGLGGNFRLQNPRTDPQVIDYCLANLNVTWGRVEMPWRFWQPAIDTSPVANAKAGKINMQVQRAMEMAQRLYKMGMPVILTAWSAPAWAIVGKPRFRPGLDNVWGNPIDHSKTNEIYKSIADYISYLKDEYGVEVSMFSFNESDLGINVRQTGAEHAELIKGLGAYFQSRGLTTKLLLGDNSDATTYEFIYPALNDAATHPYIGAISFHSWRGWDTETLQKWADAATKLNHPLLVGEGSIDAQAWGYPAIFEEQTYALEEINLYTRLLSICQPKSILQWQLTADYSPLLGGGIFGDNRTLQPTQRFWNLKQLSSTPKGLKSMALQSDGANISAAALGDNDRHVYALHLVNNGASRQVILTGLPQKVTSFQIYVTDKKRNMQQGQPIWVVNGQAIFTMDETCYTTLLSK